MIMSFSLKRPNLIKKNNQLQKKGDSNVQVLKDSPSKNLKD